MENLRVDTARIKGIEQHLEKLKSDFSNAAQVLSDLEEIQIKFESLCETHKKLKEYVSEVSRFNEKSNDTLKLIQRAQTDFEHRFAKLSETNEFKTENFDEKFREIQDELSSHHSQIDELDQNLAEKLPLFQECQSGLRALENNLNDIRNDFSSKISKIETHVDQELSSVKKYSRSQEKQMRRMRNAMIALFILWLCLAGFVLVK